MKYKVYDEIVKMYWVYNPMKDLVKDKKDAAIFDTDEVYISRQGENVVISPKKPSWDEFFNSKSAFDENFLADRQDDNPQEREFD